MESKRKNILLIGSGMCSIGVIDYLMKRKENYITIGTNMVSQGKTLALKHPDRISVVELNVTNDVLNINS